MAGNTAARRRKYMQEEPIRVLKPIEIVPNTVYMLGGSFAVDGRTSWVPSGAEGFDSVNCYLLRGKDHWLLIDTGLAVHSAEVVTQIASLVDPDTPITIFLTRAEADSLGNIGAVSAEFTVQHVYGGGFYNPFDFIDDVFEALEDDREDGVVKQATTMTLERVAPGQSVLLAGREVEVLAAPLRLLRTFWLYDTETGVLFTSDSFSHGRSGLDQSLRVFDGGAADAFDVADVRRSLYQKFEWMATVDRRPLRDELSELMQQRDVTALAPAHGGAFVTKDAARVTYDKVLAALSDDPMRH